MRIKGFIKRVCYISVLAILIAGVSSCKKSNNVSTSSVQVINASPDVGSINFYLSGGLKTILPISYGNTSGYLSAMAGNQTGEIKTADNSTTVVSIPLNLTQDAHYSVFLCGLSKDATLGSLVVQDDSAPPSAGMAKIRLVNTVANSNVEFTIDNVESAVNNTTEVLFFKNIAYKTATDFRDGITPGGHYITVTSYGPTYTTTGVNPTLVIANLSFVSGKIYTVYFKGQLGITTGAAKMDLGVIANN